MSSWLKRALTHLGDLFRRRRAARPATLRKLAGELAGLAEIAARTRPEAQEFQLKLTRMRQEMAELDRLTRRPAFRLLPPKKRLELHDSLIASRDQLARTVAETPVVTVTRQ